MTVVCRTTRSTLRTIFEPCLPTLGSWPGGGGGATGICANALEPSTAAAQSRRKNLRNAKKVRRKDSVAGGVISGFGVDAEWRESLWRPQFDFELAPARIVSLVAWSIAEDILGSQL